MTADLKGKVAVITGSTRGIGRVAALRLAARGARIVVTGRTVDPGGKLPGSLGETEAQVRAAGGEVLALAADLASADEIRRLADEVLRRFGGVDILVNNAAYMGRAAGHSLDQVQVESWNHLFAVNTTAPVLLAQALVPSMRQRGGGRIINVTSGAGEYDRPAGGTPGLAYPASKAALNLASHRMMRDLRPDNIAVILMCPGFTASESVMAAMKAWVAKSDADRFTAANAIPMDTPASVIEHFCVCPEPFAYVGPIHHAAELFEELGLAAPERIGAAA